MMCSLMMITMMMCSMMKLERESQVEEGTPSLTTAELESQHSTAMRISAVEAIFTFLTSALLL